MEYLTDKQKALEPNIWMIFF